MRAGGCRAIDRLSKPAGGPSRWGKILTLLGVVLEDATPQERTEFLAGLPAPARAFWRLYGERHHAARMRRLREDVRTSRAGTALTVFALLAAGKREALGWVMLASAAIPAGDMLTILAHHGSKAAAFGVHGATSTAVLASGLLLLRAARR